MSNDVSGFRLYDYIATLKGPVQYQLSPEGHLHMAGRPNPLSVKEDEFNFLHNLIVENRLTCGYEVATAFGVSALAAAFGFAMTEGKLASMDAYIEEQKNDAGWYADSARVVHEDADGLKSARFLAETFKLTEHVNFYVGWSPTDTGRVIEECHGNKPLDYVFIDAGHFTEWIRADITAVKPYLAQSAIVVFHDVYSDFFTSELVGYIENLLGAPLQIGLEYPIGENLGYVIIE